MLHLRVAEAFSFWVRPFLVSGRKQALKEPNTCLPEAGVEEDCQHRPLVTLHQQELQAGCSAPRENGQQSMALPTAQQRSRAGEKEHCSALKFLLGSRTYGGISHDSLLMAQPRNSAN